MTLANSIREATLAAGRLHDRLGLRGNFENGARIDVFAAATKLGVPLILRPLEGLLGAYLPSPSPGLLVTSRRPLSVQRFTAAHELGHYWMGHKPSFDDESILHRALFPDRANGDMQEMEANAFAAAFLLPRWIVNWHCKQQGWTNQSLKREEVIYQLSLRAGLSYEATCWTLQRYNILTADETRELLKVEPKVIKKKLLGALTPENFYSDVWSLSERDQGLFVEGGASDYLVLKLKEHGSAGYLWRFSARDENLAVVEDGRENIGEPNEIGGPALRRVVAHPVQNHSGEIKLVEERPWNPTEQLGALTVSYDLLGAERDGWSRAERRLRLEAA